MAVTWGQERCAGKIVLHGFLSVTLAAGIVANARAGAQDDTASLDREIGMAVAEQSSSPEAVKEQAPAEANPADSQQESDRNKQQKKEKSGEFVAATIPINSPAIGAGLEWAVGYLFRFDKERVNFRVDYGIGRVGHTFTVGIGEAF